MSEAESHPSGEGARVVDALRLEVVVPGVGRPAPALVDALAPLLAVALPPPFPSRLSAALIELVTNAAEHCEASAGPGVRVEVYRRAGVCGVAVSNPSAPGSLDALRARLEALSEAGSPKELLARTLRERRAARLKGGVGLLRLVAECGFELSVSEEHHWLTVRAEQALPGGRS